MSDVGPGLDPADREALERALGHRFGDPALLAAALAHPSWAHEFDGSRGNERLEFLGDAVLDLAVARLLYEAHPRWSEGDLTRARAAAVNTRSLARCARALGIGAHTRLGRTERKTGGADKERILANVFEALVAALYLDAGVEPVFALVRRLFAELFVTGSDPLEADPKTRFQEWSHAERGATPRYVPVADSGVENDEERFAVEVRLAGEVWGRGVGRTKRAAEAAAAAQALVRVALDLSKVG
ncbi:MAG: ribonuclease III [Proteobacteria bacterium]|nr:MAG: ribonuclease III [Pseudomonadota bacterium]